MRLLRESFKMWLPFLMLAVFPAAAGAEEYSIKIMTPAIQQAVQNRQSRYDELQGLKSQGFIGENNRGYVTVLQNQGGAQAVADAENADRQTIYGAIVEQNALGAAGMAKVQTVFAEVQRERAQPGDHIQMPAGDWVKK